MKKIKSDGRCDPNAVEPPISTSDAGGGAEQLVFDSTRTGSDYRLLYIMKGLGNDVSRLTGGEANSFAGPWPPDGQRIVYTTLGLANSDIAVINADGSNQTTLDQVQGSDEGFPNWSLDGTMIAFQTNRDGNWEIYIMAADGSGLVNLTNDPADDQMPFWQP
jgi:Tol biopolymer transport system component